MKTQNRFKLKLHLSILCLIVVFPVFVFAQQNKGETRKEKKEREKQEQLQQYEVARLLILDSTYVIPFERVVMRYGQMFTGLNSKANFLKVEGDIATLQFSSGHAPWPGMNGLGGWTLKGVLLNVKVIEKEKKNKLFITFTISGNLRNKVSISLNGSGEATVDLDHPQYGRAQSLRGPVEPIGQSRVIEGNVF